MIKWPPDLVQDLARRRAVVVIGAGVSMNSANNHGVRPKDWAATLRHLIGLIQGPEALRKSLRALVGNGDYLTACDVIRSALGQNAFCDALRAEFLTPNFIPAPIHKHIEQIDSRIVITPNFDKIYETHVMTQQKAVVVKTYADRDLTEIVRTAQRVILKIHGSIDSPAEMIFTREDYASARVKYRACYDLLSALILTHTFVFVGCGVADPDIALVLEDYAFSNVYGRHHYMVASRGAFLRPQIQAVYEKSRNLRVLNYSPINGHQELTDSLEELSKQVFAERAHLTSNLNW